MARNILLYTVALCIFLSIAVFADKIYLESKSFETENNIPVKYAMTGVPGGKNISPELTWNPDDFPKGTKSLAVIMWDEHPIANDWIHWCVINIPLDLDGFDEGQSGDLAEEAVELINSFGDKGYGGPHPPPGSGRHLYRISLYALNSKTLSLSGEVTKKQFIKAIQGRVLSSYDIVGYFEQK